MDMALPSGTPTHIHNVLKKWTRLDNVFATEHMLDTISICDTFPVEQGPNTDHIPIIMVLDMEISKAPPKKFRNFKDVDWESFNNTLKGNLAHLGLPSHIQLQSFLTRECDNLTKAIQDAIKSEVPISDINAKSKHWWSKELRNLHRESNKLGRTAYNYRRWPEHHIHEDLLAARKKYSNSIQYVKQHHWWDWLKKATDPDIWMAHKYISAPASDGGKTRIPNLTIMHAAGTHLTNSNTDKSAALAKTFFPKKPRTVHANLQDQVYPDPACIANAITKEQICKHIACLGPYKAPGPDSIPNVVLIKCANTLVDRLWEIYTAILKKGIYFAPWKMFTTIVLRKPGKPRYDTPKAYRPIALLNTMAKVLMSIIAEQLTFHSEKLNLLPTHHYGGRPARTTTDAMHALTYQIKDVWQKRRVTSVLFLDIKGAFPNAVNERLIHNMKKRRVPTALVKFTKNLLQDHFTTLKFNNFTSEHIPIDNGIGQGDPLSMVLYQYYNADILDIPAGSNKSAMAYVDDAILIVTRENFIETHQTLMDMMTRPNGALDWSKDHNSRFEFSKLVLMDFAHRNNKKER